MTATTSKTKKAKGSGQPVTGKRPGNMIRVPEETHSILREMADETGRSMQDILSEAVEEMRRRRVFELANAAYAAMRENEDEWQQELEERRLWDTTLSDGLEAQ
jgi:predicted DNA-binding protein